MTSSNVNELRVAHDALLEDLKEKLWTDSSGENLSVRSPKVNPNLVDYQTNCDA